MKVLLVHRYSFPSGRILAKALSEICGEKVRCTAREDTLSAEDIVIRYGRSDYLPNTCIGNTPRFISVSADKALFSEEVGSLIWTPIFHPFSEVPKMEDFPILLRESLSLSGGRGIHVLTSMEEYQDAGKPWYTWTKFIRTSSEFRAHCVNRKGVWEVLRLFKKIKNGGEEEAEYPIRNFHRGYQFSLRNTVPPKLAETVRNLSGIPLFQEGAFCAIDLGWSDTEKKYFIFEINSAPGLSDNSAQLLAQYLIGG